MPSFSNAMDALQKERTELAGRIEVLLASTRIFQEELDRLLEQWKEQNDPVTGKPWITVEEVAGEPWAKRLRLFNRHFLDFLITREAVLVVRDSLGRAQGYDLGFRAPGHVGQRNLALCRTVDEKDQLCTDLVDVLGDFLPDQGRSEDLSQDEEDKLKLKRRSSVSFAF